MLKSKTPAAKKQDIDKYTPLVYAVVSKYATLFPALDREDMAAEGKIGLLEAYVKFDASKNAAFSTYAWYWVVKKIQEYISKNINIIEMPQDVRNKFSSIKKLIDDSAKKGEKLTQKEIAALLSMNESEVSDIMAAADSIGNAVSLDKEVEKGGNSKTVSDFIKDDSESDIFGTIIQNSEMSSLADMLSGLSDKERQVLSLRFGLENGGKKTSLKDIGQKLAISSAKAKDLERSALIKLKGMIKEAHDE